MLEPSPRGGFAKGKVDPREARCKGAAARERNRLARLDSTRQYIEAVQLPEAIRAFDDLLADTDPRARRYRFGPAKDTLDRVMPGTKRVEVDIRAQVAALIQAFKEA